MIENLEQRLRRLEEWVAAVRAGNREGAEAVVAAAVAIHSTGGGDPFGSAFKWLRHAHVFIWPEHASEAVTCSFCQRRADSPDVEGKVVAGPMVFICLGCIGLAIRAQTEERLQREAQPCSFCNQQPRACFAAGDVRICSECINTCRDITNDERGMSSAGVGGQNG